MFDVNVSGRQFILRAAARHVIERGGGGKFINMVSEAVRRFELLVAVIGLAQAAELNPIKHGISVTAIASGIVEGGYWDLVDPFFSLGMNPTMLSPYATKLTADNG